LALVGEGVGLVEFVLSPPDIVRSINQLWLLKIWMRLRGLSQLPPLADPTAEDLAGISDNLLFTDVVKAGGATRFLVRFSGTRITEYFGASCAAAGQGRFLDEVLPVAYRDAALSTFLAVVAAGEPVYTIADMRDRVGRIVHFERLLLPFGRPGLAVDRILTSIEAVSPEGVFESSDLMAATSAPPAFAFCSIIDTSGVIAGNRP
jgi:hypothetical protein